MKVVIIGGGTAGVNTATRLRRLDENAEIVIIEKSDEFAASNCGLTYYLSGIVKNADILAGPGVEKMRQDYNIEVKLNKEVILIKTSDKKVVLNDKSEEIYDKLVLATGAMQLRPDIPGILSENIFTIRSLNSIKRIKDYIKYNYVKEVLILGGGYIGVEAAEALVLQDLKVSIVEASPHLVPNVDDDMASIIENYIRSKGIKLHLNQKVTAFNNNKANLNNGGTIAYDLAIIATGIKPDIQLPVMADLDLGEQGGLKVNEEMQTSNHDIYAAGDNVEVINLITQKPQMMPNAALAIKQARVIADVLSGKKSEFRGAISASIIPIFENSVASVGANEKLLQKNNLEYHKLHIYDYSYSTYLPHSALMLIKLLFDHNGKILGAQGIGENGIDKRLDIILSYMAQNGNVSNLTQAEYCYAPPYSTGKDALNNLGSMAESVINEQLNFIFYDQLQTEDNFLLIDVRPQEQFAKRHIDNAVNIPLAALRNNLESIPHDKKVVLYCNRARAAYNGAFILKKRGFDNIYVLSGGADLYWELEKAQQSK